MGRGGGKTPERVVTLLKQRVEETSQAAVSRETGLGLATINDYLKGKGEPTTKTLEILADYFGVTVWELRGAVAKPGVGFDDEDYDAILDESDFTEFGKRVFNVMTLDGSFSEKYYKIKHIYLNIVAKKCDEAAKKAGSDASIYIDKKGVLTVERANGKKTTLCTMD